MIVGIPCETFPGERRVAIVPAIAQRFAKAGLGVLLEGGAGAAAGFSDEQYREKGATFAASRDEVFRAADVVLQVRAFSANPDAPGAGVPMADAASVVLPGLLVFWLAILACSSAVVTAVLAFRSDAVGIGISLLLASSAVGDLVSKALRTISVEPPSLVRIPNWLLAASVGLLGGGAGTSGVSPAMVVPSLLAVAVCLALSVAAIDHVEC